MKEHELIDLLLASGQETLEKIRRSFERPESDWSSAAVLIRENEDGLCGDYFPISYSDEIEKTRIFAIELPEEILRLSPLAVLVAGPLIAVGRDGPCEGLHPAQYDGLEELLMIAAFTHQEQAGLVTKVLRSGLEPPEISRWVPVQNSLERIDGNIFAPAISALRQSSTASS